MPQQIRNNMGGLLATHYLALCDLAAEQRPRPDLIVWPETSLPVTWFDNAPGGPTSGPAPWDDDTLKKCRDDFRGAVGHWGIATLFGLDSSVCEADGRKHTYNSALLLDADGRPLGRYDKIHCVPFGEYVPFRDWLPWMEKLAPYDFDYSVTPGHNETRFPLQAGPDRRFTFGVAICYEDTDPDRTRPYGDGDGGPPVDFLLNTSNDGWFDGTSEHDEHLAICRFRAVECRRSVGRAVNMGVSALIDPDGRVLAPKPVPGMEWNQLNVRAAIAGRLNDLESADDRRSGYGLFPSGNDNRPAVWLASPGETLPSSRWAEYKKTPCVLLADVPIDHRVSLYALWGDAGSRGGAGGA